MLKVEPQAYEAGVPRDRMIPRIPGEARINVSRISKSNLIAVYKDREWLRKVHLEKAGEFVKWNYDDLSIYIKEDGFYVEEEVLKKYSLKMLKQRAYLIFSILRSAKCIDYEKESEVRLLQ